MLARLELEPLSEEAIKAARKRCSKAHTALRVAEREVDHLSCRINTTREKLIAMQPKRAKQAAKRARADAKAVRDREADIWYANL